MLDLNSPLNVSSGLVLKNRVVVPPMASQTSSENGFLTAKSYFHYNTLCQSRAGLVMVEYTYVHPTGRSEPHQLGIYSDDQIDGLKKLSTLIHSHKATSAIQLTHAGGKTSRDLTRGPLLSPSGITVPVKERELETPDEASLKDIILLKESFLNAAIRAHKSGFQIIELHSAHGYGLNQWFSPLTNQRNDKYGGSIENRARLLIEIIQLILDEIPKANLSVRIPGMDHLDGGLTYKDSVYLAQSLQNQGVKMINVSSGIGGWRRPRMRNGEGYLVDDAQEIKKHLEIPVIGVGGIQTKEYINLALNKNLFSLAAVGRSILNDSEWGKKVGLI